MESPNTKVWTLNNEEIGYYVGKRNTSASSTEFKVYMPKVMPAIPRASETETKEYISPAIFCNASDCKVQTSNFVTAANYINIPCQDNQKFRNSILKPMSKLTIKVVGSNVWQMYVTNLSDQSVEIKYSSKSTIRSAR